MKNWLTGSRAAALAAAIAILSLGAGVTTAQARTESAVQPDFTCPSPAVCVFQDNDFRGIHHTFIPSEQGGHWVSLTDGTGLRLPWGSFNDNSGSSVAFGDASTGQTRCYDAGSRVANPVVVHYRYMWIEYGVPNCTATLGRLP